MVAFDPLTAETCWRVWCTPANFNGFRVLASLLQRRRSTEVGQTLHGVWPSPELLNYIYILAGSCSPNGILPDAKFTLHQSCVILYWQRYCMAIQQWASAKVCGVVQELSPRTPPVFGRAVITLGSGLHSVMVALRNRCGHYILHMWFLSSFFLAYSQRSEIAYLPYFHT